MILKRESILVLHSTGGLKTQLEMNDDVALQLFSNMFSNMVTKSEKVLYTTWLCWSRGSHKITSDNFRNRNALLTHF